MQERTPEIDWDIFLAYSSQDNEQALELANALTSQCKVYIDRLQLKPGNTWPKKLQEAQKHSRITIALIGKATYEKAFF